MMCSHEMVQSPAEKKKRFAVYCRVSTESESQLESLENQMKAFRSRLNQHDDWELANLYVDEGLSGTSMKRRVQFRQMLEDCKAGKIEILSGKWIQTHDCEHPQKPLEIRHFAAVACFFYGKSGCYQTVEFGLPM